MAEVTAPDGRKRWNAYVVDSHHRLVYLDQNTMKTMPEARLGDRCYEVVRGESAPCSDCPWRSKNDDRLGRSVLYNHHKHAWFEATCIDIDWPDHGPCMLMASREIDESDKNLLLELDGSSAYDELIEIDVVRRTFRVLYHEPGKYVMPSMGGAFSDAERDARLSTVYEEDRDRYQALWSYENLVRVLERGAKVSGGEFRTLKEDGTWSWVSHSIVPLISEEREDPSLLCFITDVQRRKDHEAVRVGDDGDLAARDERDSITGLWGARPFLDEVERRIADADRAGGYEMVYIDIEHFKVLNDWYGREVGDRMLRALADRLASFCERHEGSVGYFGSDDFVALLPAGISG